MKSEANVASPAPKPRRPWAKMLTPAQIEAIMHEYDAGVNTAALCRKYEVSRAWLFRTRKRYVENLDPVESVTYLRAEVARLERVIVKLTVSKIEAEYATVDTNVHS